MISNAGSPNVAPAIKAMPRNRGSINDMVQTPGCESKSGSPASMRSHTRPPGMSMFGGPRPPQSGDDQRASSRVRSGPNSRVEIVINDVDDDGNDDDMRDAIRNSRMEYDSGDNIRPSETAGASGVFRGRDDANTAPSVVVPSEAAPSEIRPEPQGDGTGDASSDEIDQIQCPICWQINHDPIMLLSCAHIMCFDCATAVHAKSL